MDGFEFGFNEYFDAKDLGDMCGWVLELGFSMTTARDLEKRIREPHRFYHGPFHLNYLWKLFKSRSSELSFKERIIIGLAIVFHDSVYDI